MKSKRKRAASQSLLRAVIVRLFGWGIRAALLLLILALLLVLPWRWVPPPTTAFIVRHDLSGASRVRREWVSLDQMSTALPLAVVSAEDQKFPNHNGFDLEAISAALREDRPRKRGASTISQQLAKNLFLWPGRSLFRKALEAGFTAILELSWPKRRILEVYLNVVEFGEGVYGIGAASRYFFAKHPSQISMHEAALLAAVLPNPKQLSARVPTAYLRQRARAIERGVQNLGGKSWLPWLGS